jgi:hypothetical protein
MSAHPPEQTLKARVDYFFKSKSRYRTEVAAFAAKLADIGSVAVIGGMLRDLYLGGNRNFVSDIDFVVNAHCFAELDKMAQSLQAQRNRFGGYALKLHRWRVDVWPLQRTWAAVEGHVQVNGLQDLLKVTFFDWDAIIYDVETKKIVSGSAYFSQIDRRILEINLEPNPNPLGNAVRALRYAWRWHASFGPRLAHHVYLQICQRGWDRLIEAERASFFTRILRHIDPDELIRVLHASEAPGSPYPVRLRLSPEQRNLLLGS